MYEIKESMLLLIMLYYSAHSVLCGSVLPVSHEIVGLKGGNLSITFTVKPDPGETVTQVAVKFNGNNLAFYASFGGEFQKSTRQKQFDIVEAVKNGNDFTLKIFNIEYNDIGNFTCEAGFEKSQPQNGSIILTQVKGGPSEVRKLPICWVVDVTAENRYSFQLEGNPRPKLTWEVDGKPFLGIKENVTTVDVENHIHNYSGFIKDISKNLHGKMLKLTAIGHNTFTHQIQLNVTWGPEYCEPYNDRIIDLSPDVYAVDVCGNPLPKPSWRFGERSLVNTETIITDKNKYRFSVTLLDRQESQCAELLTCKLTGLHGREITFNESLSFSFKQKPIKDSDCIKYTVLPPHAGNCTFHYKIKFLGRQNDTLHEQTHTNNSILFCQRNIYTAAKFISVHVYSTTNNDIFDEKTFRAIVIGIDKEDSSSALSSELIAVIVVAGGGIPVAIIIISCFCCKDKVCGVVVKVFGACKKPKRDKKGPGEVSGSAESLQKNSPDIALEVYEDGNYMSIGKEATDVVGVNKDKKKKKKKETVIAMSPSGTCEASIDNTQSEGAYVETSSEYMLVNAKREEDTSKGIYYQPAHKIKINQTQPVYSQVDKSKKNIDPEEKEEEKVKNRDYEDLHDTNKKQNEDIKSQYAEVVKKDNNESKRDSVEGMSQYAEVVKKDNSEAKRDSVEGNYDRIM